MVHLDAEAPDFSDPHELHSNGFAIVQNPFEKEITVRLLVKSLSATGWTLKEGGEAWHLDGKSGETTLEVTLAPGEERKIALAARAPHGRIGTPPPLHWEVNYDGHWLEKEMMSMEEENALPLYPAEQWRMVPTWQQSDPFIIGDIDGSQLPKNPEKANPWFVKALGPEKGYEKDAVYADGQQWHPAESCARGLVNLNGLLGTLDLAATFSSYRIYSPTEQLTHGILYADNFAQTYLNGELVEEGQALRGPSPFVYVPLRLQQGWNMLSIKTVNNRGDWFLRFLYADPQENLRVDSW